MDQHHTEANHLGAFFKAMDGADEKAALTAMEKARELLAANGLSFRHLADQIEGQKLLAPAKLLSAIRLLDTTTKNEHQSLFQATRSLMKTYGLGFGKLMEAIEYRGETSQVSDLLEAHRIVNQDLSSQNAAVLKENAELRADNARLAEFEAANRELLARIDAMQDVNISSQNTPTVPTSALYINLTRRISHPLTGSNNHQSHIRGIGGTEYLAAADILQKDGRPFAAKRLEIDSVLGDDVVAIKDNVGTRAILYCYDPNDFFGDDLGFFYPRIDIKSKALFINPSSVAAAEFEPDKIYLKAIERPAGRSRLGFSRPEKAWYAAMDAQRFNFLFQPA